MRVLSCPCVASSTQSASSLWVERVDEPRSVWLFRPLTTVHAFGKQRLPVIDEVESSEERRAKSAGGAVQRVCARRSPSKTRVLMPTFSARHRLTGRTSKQAQQLPVRARARRQLDSGGPTPETPPERAIMLHLAPAPWWGFPRTRPGPRFWMRGSRKVQSSVNNGSRLARGCEIRCRSFFKASVESSWPLSSRPQLDVRRRTPGARPRPARSRSRPRHPSSPNCGLDPWVSGRFVTPRKWASTQHHLIWVVGVTIHHGGGDSPVRRH